MKCPTCAGRRKISHPCQVNHASVHECYEAGCLLPKACQTCMGCGYVVTDDILEDPAKLADFVAKHS
jgi:hypothetical protein